MSNSILKSASFDPKVKQYWMTMACFFSAVALVTIPLIPLVLFVVWLVAGKILAAMSAQLLTQKLVVKRGILFKEEKSIPLEKITDVGLNQEDNLAAQAPKTQELAEEHLNQALLARLVEVVERIDTRLAALEAKR